MQTSIALCTVATLVLTTVAVVGHATLFATRGEYHACKNVKDKINPLRHEVLLVQGHLGNPDTLPGDELGLALYSKGEPLPAAPTDGKALPTEALAMSDGKVIFSGEGRHTELPTAWSNFTPGPYLNNSVPAAVSYGLFRSETTTLVIDAFVDILGNYQVCGWQWAAADGQTLAAIIPYVDC